MKTRTIRVGVTVAAVLVAAGIASAASRSSSTTSTTHRTACINVKNTDGSFAKVKEAGVLRIGAVDGLLPYSSSDKKEPGFELEMANYVASQLCVKAKPVFVAWAGLIPGLQAHRYDVIFDGMFITPDRQKVINFSAPYYASGETIVVKRGNPEHIRNLANLKGKNVGVLKGSVTVDILKKAGVKHLTVYDTQNEILLELGNGRLDAGYLEAPSSAYVIHKQPSLKVEIVKSYVPKERYNAGVGILKSQNDLRTAINLAIRRMITTHARDRIFAKYGVPYFPTT
jgi:ABC-type amino acid transport substrate-binding protein